MPNDERMVVTYTVIPDDFVRAGEASGAFKKLLKGLGFPSDVIRRCAIAMYEGEMNMVIHAKGGEITAAVTPDCIDLELRDVGPGIPDIDLAMTEGYSTATEAVRDIGFGAGMGLPNIKKYTDSLTIESEVGVGTTVRMIIKTA